MLTRHTSISRKHQPQSSDNSKRPPHRDPRKQNHKEEAHPVRESENLQSQLKNGQRSLVPEENIHQHCPSQRMLDKLQRENDFLKTQNNSYDTELTRLRSKNEMLKSSKESLNAKLKVDEQKLTGIQAQLWVLK